MKNIWKWLFFGLIIFLIAFVIAMPFFGGRAGWPMRSVYGYGMMPGGMMGWGGFGGIGMLLGMALPLLAVAGVIALVYSLIARSGTPPPPPPVPTSPCAFCQKPLDPGWVACPYCGKKRR
jgi:hypothetical protein